MKNFIFAIIATSAVLGCDSSDKIKLASAESMAAKPLDMPTAITKIETAGASILVTGTTKFIRTVDLAPSITARIEKIYVTANTEVKTGDKLIQLDSKTAALSATQASANASSSRAQAAQLRSDLAKLSPLAKSGTVPQSRIDQLQAQLDVAESQVQAAGAAAQSARSVAQNTTLTAPFDGTVVQLDAEIGQMAIAPATTLLRIADLSVIEVTFRIKERDLGRISVGSPIDVSFPSLSEDTTGQIVTIGMEVDPQTRTAEVVANIPNPERRIRSGLFSEIRITPNKTRQGIFLPQSAVKTTSTGTIAFVIKDGIASRVEVVVEPVGDGRVEVLKGLSADQTVVTAKLDRLEEGSKVNTAIPTADSKEKP